NMAPPAIRGSKSRERTKNDAKRQAEKTKLAARRASGNGPLKRVPTYRRESRCFVCISCRALGSNAKVPLIAQGPKGAISDHRVLGEGFNSAPTFMALT